MAKVNGKNDVYANIGAIYVTMSAANTLTFQELQTYISVFDKKAMIIHKIIYAPSLASWQELDAEADVMRFGVSTSNLFTSAGPSDVYNRPDVVDFNHFYTLLSGTPADIDRRLGQFEKDFSTLAGGGLLIPARPVYGWMDTSGFAAAGQLAIRVYFTMKDITVDEYWELVESTRIVS